MVINLIQVVLVVSVIVVVFMLSRATPGARHLAIQRLLVLIVAIAAIGAIIFPSALTWVAKRLGVGRGTDLLLYAMVVAFFAAIIASSRRTNLLNRKITLLTRALSLAQADQAYQTARSLADDGVETEAVADPSAAGRAIGSGGEDEKSPGEHKNTD